MRGGKVERRLTLINCERPPLSRHSSPGDQSIRLRRRLPMQTAALVLTGIENDAFFLRRAGDPLNGLVLKVWTILSKRLRAHH
jgi:hypothetical protein